MHQYYIYNKPFGVLSQFTPEHGNTSLGDLLDVPKDVYPVGRLDKDSEGLLLLTNDKQLNQAVLHPKNHAAKRYLVQVDGIVTEDARMRLMGGVEISIKKRKLITLPCEVKVIEDPALWERNPPVRFRKNIPTSWLEIILKEGKNRQIRKMTASVGFPTLRIVRTSIAALQLHDLANGALIEMEKLDIYHKLGLA